MISTLRSIDNLLNRFDELSQCHSSFLSDFDTKFSDIKNPLRHITRPECEQRNTTSNILSSNINDNNDRLESLGALEDFHRRVLKSRYLHRPPNYSSNNGTLISHPSSKSSFTTAEVISLSKISITTNTMTTLQPVISTSNNHIIKPKINLSTNRESKLSPQRHSQKKITAFTIETVDRLSKPKRYNRLPEQRPPKKRTKQSSKPPINIKKEISKNTSVLPEIPSPSTKRTKTTTNKSSSKKLKVENTIPVQTSKRNPVRNLSRPFILVKLLPSTSLSFPTESQQKSSHSVNLPKITTIKRSMIQPKT